MFDLLLMLVKSPKLGRVIRLILPHNGTEEEAVHLTIRSHRGGGRTVDCFGVNAYGFSSGRAVDSITVIPID